MRVGSEFWDNNNISSGDGCKTLGSDGETSNNKNCRTFSLWDPTDE